MAGCFSKFFLFVLNFAIFGFGVAVITLASLILAQSGDFQVLISNGTFTLPIIFLLIGIAVMFLGFFGCFGALRESPCLLYTYATIVLVLFMAQVAVVIYGFVEADKLKGFVSTGMVEAFDQYGGSDPTFTASLDNTQHSMKCCGVYGYADWYNGTITPGLNGDVAYGCCKEREQGCNAGISGLTPEQAEDKIYTKGCFTVLVETVENEALWLIIGAVILAIVQLACVTIACGLGRNSRPETVY